MNTFCVGVRSLPEDFAALRDACFAEADAETAQRVAELEAENERLLSVLVRVRKAVTGDIHSMTNLVEAAEDIVTELTALRASRESDVQDAKREALTEYAKRWNPISVMAQDLEFYVREILPTLPLPTPEPVSVVKVVSLIVERDGIQEYVEITPELARQIVALATGAER